MILSVAPVSAGELVVALGGSELSPDDAERAGIAEIGWRFEPLGTTDLRPTVGISAHFAGVAFAGAGVAARRALSGPWFAEAVVSAGILADRRDGASDTEAALRGSVAVGRQVTDDLGIALGVSRIRSDDIRLDAVTLRLHMDF